jgi:RecJ-like exonuclease
MTAKKTELKDFIEEQVERSIEKHVNHKIDALSKKIDDYIALDTAWKQTAQPTIETFMDGKSFLKVGKYLIAGVASIGAVVITIIKIIALIKK